MATIETMFRETTVAELLSPTSSVTPLCEERKLINFDTQLSAPSDGDSRNASN